jgi:hypothetical protein
VSILVNGFIVSDDSSKQTLSFQPSGDATPEMQANALAWAVDATSRFINAGCDSIAAVLEHTGFKPTDTPTGPQCDGRLKRGRALNQHDNQAGQPISGPTTGLASRRLALLTSKGPKAGVSATVIGALTDKFDLASDQAEMSMLIGQIERILVRVGLVTLEELRSRQGSTPASADAPADPPLGEAESKVLTGVASGTTEWSDDE